MTAVATAVSSDVPAANDIGLLCNGVDINVEVVLSLFLFLCLSRFSLRWEVRRVR